MQVPCGPIHQKGHCDGCGGPLPRFRRVWCSNECEHRILVNHIWGYARSEALKRDGHACVVCHATSEGEKGRAYWKAHAKDYLEVNHINPVNGRRRNVSCQNHQDNLETLCHDCHVAITKQQRELGLIGGMRRHIWKAERLFEMGFVKCARCGAIDTSIHLSEKTKVGTTIHFARRWNEECLGKLLKDLPRQSRRR